METRYKKYIDEYTAKQKILHRKSALVGLLKFVLLIILAALVYNMVAQRTSLQKLILAGTTLVLSVPLWIYHSRISSAISKYDELKEIVKNYIQRIQGEWTVFTGKGEEYIDYQHPYTFDLDIFGGKSLYQYINSAGTAQGREQLRKDLSSPGYSLSEISDRQNATKELACENNDKFCFELQYLSRQTKESEKIDKLVKTLEERKPLFKTPWMQNIFKILPAVTLSMFIISADSSYRLSLAVPLGLTCLQILLWVCLSFKTNKYLSNIRDGKNALDEYSSLFTCISKNSFNSKLLAEIQNQIGDNFAGKAIKQLDGIVQRISFRENIILNISLNALLLWDINCCISLEKWKTSFGSKINIWLKLSGDVESLISLAVLNRTLTKFSYPKLTEGSAHSFKAVNLGHPLISNDSRIYNDFQMVNNMNVISGSNMSGKTTFLRTIGINSILAKTGAVVCADSLVLSNMQVMTSMRIVDDLQEGVSTFYAELNKIKTIVDSTEENSNILFLIDEIFRGTNSQDRTEGARAVMEKLSQNGAAGFLTTHDLKLCENTSRIKIQNYHFSELYESGKLIFNYILKTGIAKTTNGRYLMQMLGLI